MGNRCLAVIGGGPWIFDRAAAKGVDLLIVNKPDEAHFALAGPSAPVLLHDFRNLGEVLSLLIAMYKAKPFESCLSLAEFGLELAAMTNDALNLHGLPLTAVQATRNKYLMRTILEEARLNSVRFSLVNSPRELRKFKAKCPGAVIVKPVYGFASRGVMLVSSTASLDQRISYPALAEEYVEGREISVETFSFAGEHVVVALTDKVIHRDVGGNSFVEVSHIVPAAIGPETEDIRRFATNVLSALGIADGPVHLELKLNDKGLHVVEANTRTGLRVPELVRLATGVDLFDVAIEWFAHHNRSLMLPPPTTRTAVIRYLCRPPGRVDRIIGIDAAKYIPGVVDVAVKLPTGNHIPQLASSADRWGYVIAASESRGLALQACQDADAMVQVIYH